MFERLGHHPVEFGYIGHPRPYPLTRPIIRSFGEIDSIVPTLAAHETSRALSDYHARVGPGLQRELLVLLADSSVTDAEWMVIREGVESWPHQGPGRQGIRVFAVRSCRQINDGGSIVSSAQQGEFLIVNASGSTVQASLSQGGGELLLSSAVHTPGEIAERWSGGERTARWLIVLLPPAPDEAQFVHADWARMRNALVSEFQQRGGDPSMRISLIPAAFLPDS